VIRRARPGEALPIRVGAHRNWKITPQVGHRRIEIAAPELIVERGENKGAVLAEMRATASSTPVNRPWIAAR